jgi:hypothetical protein
MPSIEELESSIITQCLDPDGLLVSLRYNKFDDEKYHKLIATLRAYREAIRDQKFLNRKVAGFLRTIEGVFEGSVIYYDHQPVKSEDGRKISNAYARIFDLMDKIFDVNFGDELDLSEWETMWTSQIDDYLLVTGNQLKNRYVIFRISTTTALIIEDDDISAAIIEKMKAAGVKIVNSDYLKRFLK